MRTNVEAIYHRFVYIPCANDERSKYPADWVGATGNAGGGRVGFEFVTPLIGATGPGLYMLHI